jgi:hypothetical protein
VKAQCINNSQAASQQTAGAPSIQTSQAAQQEPAVPEEFKAQKAGKAKVEESAPGEGSKPFCFRCYKPGHDMLECKAKLFL